MPNIKHVRAHWDDILRLASSIKQGTVTASLMLRKLGSYPRQNGLAVALRELGRIERTLFIPDWLQSVELRRRVHAGLNKGEARNSLARAVFFNRLGEIRDRSFEQQRYRASGLNLVTAAIVLWNTVYRTRHPGVGRGRQAGGRRAAAIPVAAGLGAHQPNRRLRLAAEPQTGRREVSALTDARKTLAYDFFRILRAPLSHLRKAEREDGRPGPRPRAPGARGRARTRATAHERTPQQERQKAAREAERGREAWTLGQGMKKPVAGCYGRLTRWKGGGDVVYMALL